MTSGPNLRPVPSSVGPDTPAPPEPPSADAGRHWASGSVLVIIVLLIAVVVLAWSRVQMSDRIEVLEEETRILKSAVAERDRALEAHRERLDDVRTQVEELRSLLDAPLPQPEP